MGVVEIKLGEYMIRKSVSVGACHVHGLTIERKFEDIGNVWVLVCVCVEIVWKLLKLRGTCKQKEQISLGIGIGNRSHSNDILETRGKLYTLFV